jgi:SAM-dependent methyltransferase
VGLRMFSLRKANKKSAELEFWKDRHREEGVLDHGHYERFYTSIFGLTQESYDGKRILDIGCGPRGSLEWANRAADRIGLDPLAQEYKKLGTDKHQMTYVNARSDKIPFPDGYFDVVASFNSLDHVDELERTIQEIIRVTRRSGVFLLIVEINHPPTQTEPISLKLDSVLGAFASGFTVNRSWCCAMLPEQHDIYGSVLANKPPVSGDSPAVLCALLARN